MKLLLAREVYFKYIKEQSTKYSPNNPAIYKEIIDMIKNIFDNISFHWGNATYDERVKTEDVIINILANKYDYNSKWNGSGKVYEQMFFGIKFGDQISNNVDYVMANSNVIDKQTGKTISRYYQYVGMLFYKDYFQTKKVRGNNMIDLKHILDNNKIDFDLIKLDDSYIKKFVIWAIRERKNTDVDKATKIYSENIELLYATGLDVFHKTDLIVVNKKAGTYFSIDLSLYNKSKDDRTDFNVGSITPTELSYKIYDMIFNPTNDLGRDLLIFDEVVKFLGLDAKAIDKYRTQNYQGYKIKKYYDQTVYGLRKDKYGNPIYMPEFDEVEI